MMKSFTYFYRRSIYDALIATREAQPLTQASTQPDNTHTWTDRCSTDWLRVCLVSFSMGATILGSLMPAFALQPEAGRHGNGEASQALALDNLLNATQPDQGLNTASSDFARPLLLSQIDSSYLSLDDSGDAVTALQTRLSELGYYQGTIDGYFGPGTEAAVIQFQQDQGLTADGVVGSETAALLNTSNRQSSTVDDGSLQLDDAGDEVTALQSRLRELGYFNDEITGYFGPVTQAAVIRFQQANGLTADGVVGSTTAQALRSSSTSRSAQSYSPPNSSPAQSFSTTQSFSAAPTPNDGILQSGDTGSNVLSLQTRLRELGYYRGPLDGNYGATTEAAVSQFQQASGLTPDGIVGPVTAQSLGSAPRVAITPASTPLRGSRFSIIELQRRLQSRGFNPGAIDGVAGEQTRAAIAAAQRAYGLSENDILNGRF